MSNKQKVVYGVTGGEAEGVLPLLRERVEKLVHGYLVAAQITIGQIVQEDVATQYGAHMNGCQVATKKKRAEELLALGRRAAMGQLDAEGFGDEMDENNAPFFMSSWRGREPEPLSPLDAVTKVSETALESVDRVLAACKGGAKLVAQAVLDASELSLFEFLCAAEVGFSCEGLVKDVPKAVEEFTQTLVPIFEERKRAYEESQKNLEGEQHGDGA
jgi:hypothetical protein